jgi:hypothetical protein
MFSFCLEDGSVLSPSLDQNIPATVASAEPKTAILPKTEKNEFWKAVFIGLISVFTIFLIISAVYYSSRPNSGETVPRGAANDSNTTVKTTPPPPSPAISLASTPPKNSNAPAENTNLKSNALSPPLVKTPETDTPDGALKKMKQGMSYAAARKMLMAGGWQAVAPSPNRELFGQEEFIVNKLKFYEMEACSGTGAGYCRFLFRDVDKRKLVVVTVNNEEGIKGGPLVENWSFEK